MRASIASLSALVFSSLALPSAHAVAQEWTRFQNGGVGPKDGSELPVEWSAESGVLWSVPVDGYGQSTPLVRAGRVYVTFTEGEMKDTYHVRALDLETGATQWDHALENSSPEKNSVMVSRAAPTPVVDDAGIVAFFEGGNLVALDHEGEVRWERDLVQEFGGVKARHGLAASLEHDGDVVYVWVEREEDPYVLAVSKDSGETIWKTEGAGGTSWASPRLVLFAEGERHLVLSGSGRIVGLDPSSGERLWTLADVSNNTSNTPIPLGNGRFLVGASEGRGEQPAGAPKSNGVVQVAKDETGAYTAEYVWRARRAMSSFGSPAVAGDNAYFVNRAGIVFCIDLETGEQHYSERCAESIWATPIAAAGRVYLFGKDGTTTVIKGGDTFEVLAENTLWKEEEPEPEPGPAEGEGGRRRGNFGGPVLYAAALTKDRIVMRRGDQVYCVGATRAH
ncbi:MAG: PQQ-binding-like beta-propeller repeat protein [Planctomycetota bacterium]